MIDDPVQRLTKFFYCLDTCRWEDLLALTHTDMVWHRFNGIIKGHAEIRPMLEARPLTSRVCHLVSSAFVDSSASDIAAGRVLVRAYMTAYRVDGAGDHQGSLPMTTPPKIGRADSVFVKTEKGWLISEQTLVALFNF